MEPARLVRLACKRFHRRDSGDALLQLAREFLDHFLQVVTGLLDSRRQDPDHRDVEWNDDQRNPRQPHVQREQEPDHEAQRHAVHPDVDHRGADEVLRHRDVGNEARHHRARGRAIEKRMRQALHVQIQRVTQVEDQPMTRHARPVIAVVGRNRLNGEQREQRRRQRFELGRRSRAEMKRSGKRTAPSIDHLVQMLGMRLRNQQNIEHVFESERKRERQRELQDPHHRPARHQPQMRPDVAEKAHQRSLWNDAVEDPLEKTAATLVGLVGSAGRLPGGTVRRHRRAGNQSRTTIWHARQSSSAARRRKYV